MALDDDDLIYSIRSAATALGNAPQDGSAVNISALMKDLTDKYFVLLGEATHGTREFYQARVEITKRLIIDHGITAIAIEGDWPSAARVNRYVRRQGVDANANEALSDFTRFPLWMWRNTVLLDFVIWLRRHNEGLPLTQQVGFYGLDMYSMYESVAAVLEYLDRVDPDAAADARAAYACLDRLGSERHYGYGVSLGKRASCEEEVVRQLMSLREAGLMYAREGNVLAEDDQFEAEQNARLIQSAESYYRQMFDRRVNTWNLRDSHMLDTLDHLHRHLTRRLQRPAKIVVWAHNSHVGDARATYMGERSQHTLGQLTRERYGSDACALLGFTTYTGTVTAASDWDGPAERKRVRPALTDSLEAVFHRTGLARFYLPLTGDIAQIFRRPRLQRAIGVLYLPESERASHYYECRLNEQFDAIVHIDQTHALEPLDPTSEWVAGEQATYPFNV